MDTAEIVENCERIISTLIEDFLVNQFPMTEETEDLVFETISTLDGLIVAVRET